MRTTMNFNSVDFHNVERITLHPIREVDNNGKPFFTRSIVVHYDGSGHGTIGFFAETSEALGIVEVLAKELEAA